jgi:hypothetical protein
VAGTDTGAVENVLDAGVDVNTLASASNLDAVREGRDRTMSPTRTAVLWDVLIATHRTVVDAVLVAPVEGSGHCVRLDEASPVRDTGMVDLKASSKLLLTIPNLAAGLDRESQKASEEGDYRRDLEHYAFLRVT